MQFIESPIFDRIREEYLNDDEFSGLQHALMLKPDAGKVIPGGGGVRKLRWPGRGHGKRGGLRIIYYWRNRYNQIWFLTIYAKNEAEDIPAKVLKALREELPP